MKTNDSTITNFKLAVLVKTNIKTKKSVYFKTKKEVLKSFQKSFFNDGIKLKEINCTFTDCDFSIYIKNDEGNQVSFEIKNDSQVTVFFNRKRIPVDLSEDRNISADGNAITTLRLLYDQHSCEFKN